MDEGESYSGAVEAKPYNYIAVLYAPPRRPSSPRSPVMWLGLDLSTQSLTAALLSSKTGVPPLITSVNFDEKLPKYGTKHGMHVSGSVVTSPVSMWLDAIDSVFQEVKALYPKELSEVEGVSISGQQHGTVYWAKSGLSKLRALKSVTDSAQEGIEPGAYSLPQAEKNLAEILEGAFAREECPIWADSSTVEQCEAFNRAMGGAREAARVTGSAAYPRFAGQQIAKIMQTQPNVYRSCERISLVSSFAACILTGDYVGVDRSDAAGMNMMEIFSQNWSEKALTALLSISTDGSVERDALDDLRGKLGHLVDSHAIVGRIAPYFTRKYGLKNDCLVVAASGDNPNALAGMGIVDAEAGAVLGMSLGTSDTVMGVMKGPTPQIYAMVLPAATDLSAYIVMLVYKNGSIVRERIRDECCGGDWKAFEEALASTPPANNGKLSLLLGMPEITPQIDAAGDFYSGVQDPILSESDLSAAERVRAVVEGRFLSMRAKLTSLGLDSPKCIYATGGGARNQAILQVIADVFNTSVYKQNMSDAAAVGGK
jgi:xylulokinase